MQAFIPNSSIYTTGSYKNSRHINIQQYIEHGYCENISTEFTAR